LKIFKEGKVVIDVKTVRKQLRIVVKEIIGEILSSEVGEQLRKENDERLTRIENQQKDIMSYMIRATTPKRDVK